MKRYYDTESCSSCPRATTTADTLVDLTNMTMDIHMDGDGVKGGGRDTR